MNVKYIHSGINLGFGSGHNIALKKAIEINSKFHFIINPDIIISDNVIWRKRPS
jgi:GT2 family glycosyltransferase